MLSNRRQHGRDLARLEGRVELEDFGEGLSLDVIGVSAIDNLGAEFVELLIPFHRKRRSMKRRLHGDFHLRLRIDQKELLFISWVLFLQSSNLRSLRNMRGVALRRRGNFG